MISSEEAVLDELFGTVGEPDWSKIGNLLQAVPDLSAPTLLRLQWIEQNDPELFDAFMLEFVNEL